MKEGVYNGVLCVERTITPEEVSFYKNLEKSKIPFFQIILKVDGNVISEEAMVWEEVVPDKKNNEALYKMFSYLKKNKLSCKIEKFYLCDGVLKAYISPSKDKFSEERLCSYYAQILGIDKKFFYIECVYNWQRNKSRLKNVPGFRSGNALNSFVGTIIYFNSLIWIMTVQSTFGFDSSSAYYWIFWYIVTGIGLFTLLDFFYIAERLVPINLPRWVKIGVVFALLVGMFSIIYLTVGFVVIEGGA